MKRPNIVLIYSDQLRYDCIAVSGNPTVETPAIDALAGDGCNFLSAYTSFPLCCPFRASLMTGLYAHKHGMLTNHYPIDLNHAFLPGLMKEGGYRTGWFGKWHLNGGNKYSFVPKEYQLGFDEFVGFSRGHNYLQGIYYRNDDEQPYKSKKYEPEYQTDHIIEFMENSAKEGNPFLAMICYGLPHPPVDSAPDHIKYRYSPDTVQLLDTVPPALVDKEKAYRAKHYGMVNCVDNQVLRLTNWLKMQGLEEDTVVIFVSDHGDMNGEYGLHHKSSYYEASMHVPCIIKYPRMIAKGGKIEHLIDPSVDLMPTILDFASIPIPREVQGQSLKPLFTGEKQPPLREYVLFQLPNVSKNVCEVLERQEWKLYPERGLRTKDFLYIERDAIPFALFDLKADASEKFNCIDNVYYNEKIEELRARLASVMVELGDDWSFEASEPPNGYQSHADAEMVLQETYGRAMYED